MVPLNGRDLDLKQLRSDQVACATATDIDAATAVARNCEAVAQSEEGGGITGKEQVKERNNPLCVMRLRSPSPSSFP